MVSDRSMASFGEPVPGLPPVEPPSGKFIAQLFLVPFLIVASLVGFAFLVKWLAGSAWSPQDYLNRLDDTNADIRWRGAESLAQVLLRDDQLASDPKFALDLCERLERALRSSRLGGHSSSSASQRNAENAAPSTEPTDSEEQQLLYLCACLGNVTVPVGASLLEQMAIDSHGTDPKSVVRRRWRAVWSLANLGENVRRFPQLSEDRRQVVLAALDDVSHTGTTERSKRATQAIQFFRGTQAGNLEPLGIETALSQCASDTDPFLREITAYAYNFWEGTPAENKRIEEILARLARDDGRGEDVLAEMHDDADRPERSVVRSPGLKIRYNATIALARRGSELTRLGVLQEMLDPEQQARNFQIRHKDGSEVADAPMASLTTTTALRAIQEWHRRQPERNFDPLLPAVQALATSPDSAIRAEALRARLALTKS